MEQTSLQKLLGYKPVNVSLRMTAKMHKNIGPDEGSDMEQFAMFSIAREVGHLLSSGWECGLQGYTVTDAYSERKMHLDILPKAIAALQAAYAAEWAMVMGDKKEAHAQIAIGQWHLSQIPALKQ